MTKSKLRLALGLDAQAEYDATGCLGVDSYRDYAELHGFKHIELIDTTSSAGDWAFIASKDGREWRMLCQYNKYPFPGFRHEFVEGMVFHGAARDVQDEIFQRYYEVEI